MADKPFWPSHASDWKDAVLIGRNTPCFVRVNILEDLGDGCDIARGDVDANVDFVGTSPIKPPGLVESAEADGLKFEARQRARRQVSRLRSDRGVTRGVCQGAGANNRKQKARGDRAGDECFHIRSMLLQASDLSAALRRRERPDLRCAKISRTILCGCSLVHTCG